ncbi:MAG TPA: T9SS type A sorting domain-containing protein [Bacteroidales bacterium]
MKKLVLILLTSYFINGSGFSQVVFPEVISTFGGSVKNSMAEFTWTVGEPLYQTVSADNSILTQGFNQITKISTDTAITLAPDVDIIAFPNPTSATLQVKIQSEKFKGYQLEILDAQGRSLSFTELGSNQVPIDMSGFSGGLYFLKITDKGKLIKVIKIQKIK